MKSEGALRCLGAPERIFEERMNTLDPSTGGEVLPREVTMGGADWFLGAKTRVASVLLPFALESSV